MMKLGVEELLCGEEYRPGLPDRPQVLQNAVEVASEVCVANGLPLAMVICVCVFPGIAVECARQYSIQTHILCTGAPHEAAKLEHLRSKNPWKPCNGNVSEAEDPAGVAYNGHHNACLIPRPPIPRQRKSHLADQLT